MGGGGKGGGGGSSEITVTSTSTSSMDSNTTVDILGLDNMNTRTELVLPDPIRTESTNRNELAITQPIVTQSTSRNEVAITEPIVSESTNRMLLDIRPLQIDTCIQFSMGPIPPMCVRQPYHHHFGITLFGMEVFGFTFSGESQVIIEEPAPRPQVMWGGEQVVKRPPPPRSRPGSAQPESGPVQESTGGLRIRLT